VGKKGKLQLLSAFVKLFLGNFCTVPRAKAPALSSMGVGVGRVVGIAYEADP
jgi:hypothetical protein